MSDFELPLSGPVVQSISPFAAFFSGNQFRITINPGAVEQARGRTGLLAASRSAGSATFCSFADLEGMLKEIARWKSKRDRDFFSRIFPQCIVPRMLLLPNH